MSGITRIISVEDQLADEETCGFIGDDALGTYGLAPHGIDG